MGETWTTEHSHGPDDRSQSHLRDELATLTRHAVGMMDALVREEVELAKRHGFAPTIPFPVTPADDPLEQIAQLRAVLEELAAGRRRFGARLDHQSQRAGNGLAPDSLRSRVGFLIDRLDGQEQPANDEETWQDRLTNLEHQAEERRQLVARLVDKAYIQGRVIGDLRAEIDRLAAADPQERAALARLNTHSIDPDEFVVLHDEIDHTAEDDPHDA